VEDVEGGVAVVDGKGCLEEVLLQLGSRQSCMNSLLQRPLLTELRNQIYLMHDPRYIGIYNLLQVYNVGMVQLFEDVDLIHHSL